MTEQPAEEPRKKPDLWSAFGANEPARRPPVDPYAFTNQQRVSKDDYAGLGLTDKMLEALGVPPKPSERPPVELSAERRAHVARFAAEYKEWVANGMTSGQALGLVSMEIQLEAQLNRRFKSDDQ